MRVVFMGTPDFSVGTLRELAKAGHEIAGVISQPDKPKGRGKNLQPTPVKEAAMELGLPVYQPQKVRDPEFIQVMKELNINRMRQRVFWLSRRVISLESFYLM